MARRREGWAIAVLLLASTLVVTSCLDTRAAPDPKPLPSKAGVVTLLDGNAVARRVAVPDAIPLKIDDDLFLQDTITTGDGARMDMVLDSKVLVSMPERTVVTISEVSGRGTLDLGAGQLTLNARGDRPQSGQALEIRTPNAVAILRGSARLRVETASLTHQSRTAITHIDVLDGSISVAINVDFGNQLLYRGATPAPIDLGANQGLTITGEVPGAIRPLRTVSPPTK
jgi:hypothetical protein